MRIFTLEQYQKMSERFNKMSFMDKIRTLQNNSDILTLASDHNWWGVKVIDKDIEEQLFDTDSQFRIPQEWDVDEMCGLIALLGIGNTDI